MGNISPFAATIAAFTPTAARKAEEPKPSSRYRVVAPIGEGGMGRVLEVVDEQFGRHVALKELLPDARGGDVEERFLAEAVVTANLEHPGIAPVYDRGRREDGSPYYTMQRVRGRTLADAVHDAKSMRERLAHLPAFIAVAQTLAFAHERGVIHRDIKPANVFVGPRGEAFVLDWGIAKVRGVEDHAKALPATVTDTGGKTQAGAVFGTLAYMAPEQARGDVDAIDERTDVFCVGALLYHLLTGRAPYDGKSVAEVLADVKAAKFPSVGSIARDAPLALRAIVERAMAKEPADRYATAVELADALRAASSDALLAPSAGAAVIARAVEVGLVIAAGGGLLLSLAKLQFVELGVIAWFTVGFSVMGLALSLLEWREKGRTGLSALCLAIALSTFLIGVVATMLGLHMTLESAQAHIADEAKWRMLVTEGTRESIGNLVLGGELAMVQLLAWGFVSRAARRTGSATSPHRSDRNRSTSRNSD